MKMIDVDNRLADLESRRMSPGLSVAEQNELRDCEITLGMVDAPPAPVQRLRVESNDLRPSEQLRKHSRNLIFRAVPRDGAGCEKSEEPTSSVGHIWAWTRETNPGPPPCPCVRAGVSGRAHIRLAP